MRQKKILVVDDERDLCDILLFNLRSNGYWAEACCSAEEAIEKIEELKSGKLAKHAASNASNDMGGFTSPPFDLCLLDVMMPGMSGFELAARWKAEECTSQIPIIFLTAKDSEDDTLHGFDLGADDYVTKPFSVREVMARVKAVLNRSVTRGEELQSMLAYEGLQIDLQQKTVSVDEEMIELTKTEFELLYLLLSHSGRVFSRQELIEAVWPRDVIVTSRTVDVNLARLRKKLGRYSGCIVARQGFGYLFEK